MSRSVPAYVCSRRGGSAPHSFNQPRYNAAVQSGNRRMTPQQFINKWQGCQLAERAFYQQHFNDLCALLGHPTPAAQDTTGDTFCFEKGATKTGGGNGWADVWKRGFFAVEYKGQGGDLHKALEQVQ